MTTSFSTADFLSAVMASRTDQNELTTEQIDKLTEPISITLTETEWAMIVYLLELSAPSIHSLSTACEYAVAHFAHQLDTLLKAAR